MNKGRKIYFSMYPVLNVKVSIELGGAGLNVTPPPPKKKKKKNHSI